MSPAREGQAARFWAAEDWPLTYTVTYSNPSREVLPDVVLSTDYGRDVSFVGALPAPDADTDDRWSIGDLGAGEWGSILITVITVIPSPVRAGTIVLA